MCVSAGPGRWSLAQGLEPGDENVIGFQFAPGARAHGPGPGPGHGKALETFIMRGSGLLLRQVQMKKAAAPLGLSFDKWAGCTQTLCGI